MFLTPCMLSRAIANILASWDHDGCGRGLTIHSVVLARASSSLSAICQPSWLSSVQPSLEHFVDTLVETVAVHTASTIAAGTHGSALLVDTLSRGMTVSCGGLPDGLAKVELKGHHSSNR